MDDKIKRIYELMYSPIITPYNLLENAKLQNYSYVKYYRDNSGLICEMKCTMEDQSEAVFYYQFDIEDKLSNIYVKDGRKKVLIYSRQSDLEDQKSLYFNQIQETFSKKAI
jgi:hypothetical protein